MLVKINELTKQQIASICDHTYLNRPEAFRGKAENSVEQRKKEFYSFLERSVELKPYAICVRPEDCQHTKDFLGKTDIVIASVVGFPDGNWYSTKIKVAETDLALSYGAKRRN
jgi:deoxyribose-phosphate aldolase